MELELGLAPPNAHRLAGHLHAGRDDLSTAGKRAFREPTTLPLFDDGSSGVKRRMPLVGWPPVRPARGAANYVKVKKEGVAIGRKLDLSLQASYDHLLATLARMFPAETPTDHHDQEQEDSTQVLTSSDHHCHSRHHAVTYQDGEGDWMLVGDVPWDDFARSVKRLKIMGS